MTHHDDEVQALAIKISRAHEHHKDMMQAMVDAEAKFHTLMDELHKLVPE